MTDDLVKRLHWHRDFIGTNPWPDGYPFLQEVRDRLRDAADRIETLTAQLESTLKDRAAIIAERDRTFALMLARAEKAELERDALREDVEELDFLRHEGGPDSVAAIEADNARLREALAVDPWFLGRREWAMHIRFALKGETP